MQKNNREMQKDHNQMCLFKTRKKNQSLLSHQILFKLNS